MLGPEVKHSQLMIDDANLQPEVVWGEAGRRGGVPTPSVPHDVVIPSLYPLSLHVFNMPTLHTQTPIICLSSGWYRQGPGPGQGKGRGKQGNGFEWC